MVVIYKGDKSFLIGLNLYLFFKNDFFCGI